jgi:hypothetical protein
MRKRYLGAAVLAGGILATGLLTGVAGAGSSGDGTHARTLVVIEHPDTDAIVHLNADGKDHVGDLLPFNNPVYDAANKVKVGDDQGNCIHVRVDPDNKTGAYECNWTTNLKGGSITVEGAFLDAGPSTLAVIGGTGRYKLVRGTMDLAATPEGNYSFTFRLR